LAYFLSDRIEALIYGQKIRRHHTSFPIKNWIPDQVGNDKRVQSRIGQLSPSFLFPPLKGGKILARAKDQICR
jgi:hypothetical protein